MKFILILLSLVLSISSLKAHRYKRTPIINGSPVKIRNAPYFASLMAWDSESGKWFPACGATILSDSWLVTATHCIRQPRSKTPKIRTGSDDHFWVEGVDSDDVIHEIGTLYDYPGYSAMEKILYNDICLIKLKTPMKLKKNEQWPILLPNPKCALKPKTEITIVGFGSQIFTGKNEDASENNKRKKSQAKNVLPSKLLSGKVTVLDEATCKEKYSSNRITQEQFCATSKKHEVGNFDSGGPAVVNNQLVGIISIGNIAGEKPGVYVNVRDYVDWIIEKTGIDNIAPVDSTCCLKKLCMG